MTATTTPTSNLQSFLGSDPNLNRLYDNIQVVVPAVGLSLIKMAAWNTIEDFYVRSTMRREQVEFQMGVGVQQIDFNPFDETWLVAWVLSVGGLTRVRIIPPSVVLSLEAPTGIRKGAVLLALRPVNFTVVFPGELWSQYFETILAGTLARLYEMPAKPWSSPQLAQYNMRKFNGGVAAARGIAQAGYTEGGGRWTFAGRGFANGRRKN